MKKNFVVLLVVTVGIAIIAFSAVGISFLRTFRNDLESQGIVIQDITSFQRYFGGHPDQKTEAGRARVQEEVARVTLKLWCVVEYDRQHPKETILHKEAIREAWYVTKLAAKYNYQPVTLNFFFAQEKPLAKCPPPYNIDW